MEVNTNWIRQNGQYLARRNHKIGDREIRPDETYSFVNSKLGRHALNEKTLVGTHSSALNGSDVPRYKLFSRLSSLANTVSSERNLALRV